MTWVTADEVKKYAQINYSDFKPGLFLDETDLSNYITNTILPAVEGHIEAYCGRDFDALYPSGIPEALKNIARIAATNILFRIKVSPIVKPEDLNQISQHAVLTPDIINLLEPWRGSRKPITKSSSYLHIQEESPC